MYFFYDRLRLGEIQTVNRLPCGFRLRFPRVILSEASAKSNCVAAPKRKLRRNLGENFAQDDTDETETVVKK